MQGPNKTEYVTLRREMESMKKCMTDYMGFLLLGTGAVVSAWGGIGILLKDEPDLLIAMGYSSLGLSLIVTLMLVILVYKFVSHNRYAGYSLVLSSEVWPDGYEDTDILTWELCVSLLRANDHQGMPNVRAEYREFRETFAQEETTRKTSTILGGLVFLARVMLQFQKSSSWGFPITIIRIFAVVSWACIIFGVYATINQLWEVLSGNVGGIFCAAILVLQVLLWANIAKRFHSVMVGDATVLRFAQRFLPVREKVLQQALNTTPRSLFTEFINTANR